MKSIVNFVGAGPGAEDLITVRGRRLLEEADLVLYAGSLVNPGHLACCKPSCRRLDSAGMDLAAQVDCLSEAAEAGRKVVRLHTGDPAMYGAINEQIRGLAERGIQSVIVPGVSSVFAAAAALGCELTCPDGSQSVVLTRTPGRTPMPAAEDAAAFARTGATLAFFLSTGHIAALSARLMKEGGLAPETPAAVVYRASWPDERVLRGSLADIAAQVEAAGIGRQALILVGEALRPQESSSRLYDAQFSHGYRNHLPAEHFDGPCAVYAFTAKGLIRAREMAAGLDLPVRIFCTRPLSAEETAAGIIHLPGEDFDAALRAQWRQFAAHVFISATGIAVRKIAPLLEDKSTDPAVLACPESGSHIISLTSGHLGGANRLARRIARLTGGQAVIGTATDVNGLPAFDEVAARLHARVLTVNAIRPLNAALLAGESITFCGPREIYDAHFAATGQVVFAARAEDIRTPRAVLWDAEGAVPTGVEHLDITSRALVLGLGCRRGTAPETLRREAEACLARLGIAPGQIARLASCSIKADEEAILALAREWGTPLDLYPAEKLDEVPVPTPSATVQARVGTASVSEAACLLSAGKGGRLLQPKVVGEGVTLALACLPHLAGPSRERGRVLVVGLGSGDEAQITPQVSAAIADSDVLAGYGPYLDFIRQRIGNREVIQNGMMGEVERCRRTLESAAAGHTVCMVCSGDPGILAMAGLLFELRSREAAFHDIPITVLPGITAANIAAASLGAPLQNGFSLVSLSDLLVPADEVRRNLRAVAASALPVTLYNPAGRKRRHLLEEALRIFREERGEDLLCAWVKNAGRPQEERWVGRLADFPADDVDMSTLVLMGSARTRYEDGVLYEARGYVEKYLDGKA